MALNKLTPSATPAFESEDDTFEKETAVATPVATTAVAVQAPAAVAIAKPAAFAGARDVIGELKDRIEVSYNTLEAIIASNGNFLKRETKQVLGDNITFELLSFQDSYVVQAGNDKADKSTVRYSDDGVVCSDGTLVTEHLQALKDAGWPLASVKQRMVVVGSVLSTAKPSDLVDELVQFDLSPKSRDMFVRYKAKAANAIRLGKATEDAVTKVSASTRLSTSGSNTFTLIDFTVAPV